MAVSLEELASIGEANWRRKVPTMEKAYPAAKSRAIDSYEDMPFGPTRTEAYRKAWETMPENYKKKVKPELGSKWHENWVAKMSE